GAQGDLHARPEALLYMGEAERLLRRLEWTALRPLDGLLHGNFRTLFRGTGIDLVDLREYQVQDDVRHIDWNVTARLQIPHVRQYAEDREMSAWLLADLSPSTAFGSGPRSKRDITIEFAVLMAQLIASRGNRVGAMIYGGAVDTIIPARSGRRQLLEIAHRLLREHPHARVGTTRLAELFERAAAMIRGRSTVFVLTDFISQPGWEAPLGRLAKRHDVLAVRLTDPLETVLPEVGLMTFEDPETGEQLFIDSSDPALRARFDALARAQREAIEAALARAGVPLLTLSTDRSLLDNVLAYLAERRQRARRAGNGSALAASSGRTAVAAVPVSKGALHDVANGMQCEAPEAQRSALQSNAPAQQVVQSFPDRGVMA
ncbi:MAG: DUF58 domain-containing protein, partial [Casimicrobiaceae bacterium]